MDYAQFVNELKNSHSDTIEILSDKLVAWLTTAGTTTFELSSGDVTLQNVPNISLGKYTVSAGENISVNAPVRFYNDGGTIKAKSLKESVVVESSCTDLSAVDQLYYCSTYDRVLHLNSDGSTNEIIAKIGTIASDGTISYGASIPIYSGTTLYPMATKVVSMGADNFVITILEDDNLILLGGKFSNASTIVLGSELDTSKSLVTGFSVSSNESNTVNLVFSTSTADLLFSELYTYSNVDYSLVLVVDSNKTISASTIIADSYRNCFDSVNERFHCLYSNRDETYEYLRYCSIDSTIGTLFPATDELSKTVLTKIHYFPSGLFYDPRTNNLILLSSTEYVDLNYVDLDVIRIDILDDDIMLINTNKILNPSLRVTSGMPTLLNSYFDIGRNLLVFNYSGYNSDKSAFVEVLLSDVPQLKRFEVYRFDSGVTSYCGNSIIKAGNFYVFKPILEEKIFSCNVDERDLYIGFANETKTSGNNILISISGDTISTFSELNVGSTYFLQKDMTISEVFSNNPIGKAVSTTSLRLF